MCFDFAVVMSLVAIALQPLVSSSILVDPEGAWSRLARICRRKSTSCNEAHIAMYSVSAVDRATVDWSLLPHTTDPPHIMAMNPVLGRLFSPSPKEESCHMIASGEMFPVNVRQNECVPLRYRNSNAALCSWTCAY